MDSSSNQPRDLTGKDPLTELSNLELIVFQQAEKMQALENQVSKLREEVDDLRGAPDASQPVTGEADPDQDPRDLLAVTRRRLDCGDAFKIDFSIWDACLFVGHQAVGRLVSCVAVFVWAFNIAMQVWFMVSVWNNMLEPEVTEAALDQLLRYRIAAHSVEFADELTRHSMLYQVCNDPVPGKLFQSGAQSLLYYNLSEFNPASVYGGKSLMFLAQIIWICFILKEINTAWNFGRSLANVGIGKRTRIVMNEKDAMSGLDDEATKSPGNNTDETEVKRTPTGSVAPAISMMIVCRVCSITRLRFWLALVLIVVPRILIAIAMGIVGCAFLGKTSNMEDLVLNAIALLFISDIDNVLYSVFAPRRLHTLMDNMEAFPMPHKNRLATAGIYAVIKVTIVTGAMFAVYFLVLDAFFWRLETAQLVMCGGNTDFVWAINPASGMVHVTRSNPDVTDISAEELVILQVAAPPIPEDYSNYWESVSDAVVKIAIGGSQRAVWEPSSTSYDVSTYDESYFSKVSDMQGFIVSEASESLACADLSSGQDVTLNGVDYDVALTYLRIHINSTNSTSCDDVPWHMCSYYANDQIRALCPVRCGCDKPARYYYAYAGFYQSPEAGCPTQCNVVAGARNEILYGTAAYLEASDTSDPQGTYACLDTEPNEFTFSQGCVSMDQFDLARSRDLKTCRTASCGPMFDDTDFTANDMCCKCGGGMSTNNGHAVGQSLLCLDSLTDDCQTMDPQRFYYLMWVRGLKERLEKNTEYIDHVNSTIYHEANLIGLNETEKAQLYQWMQTGNFYKSLLDGDWNLMPGLPHPRNLRGCGYLASFEVKSLLGLDICSDQSYRGLKLLCPLTCGCRREMYSISTDQNGQESYNSTDGTFVTYTYARDDLYHCPASCIVPHSQVDGNSQYEEYDGGPQKPK